MPNADGRKGEPKSLMRIDRDTGIPEDWSTGGGLNQIAVHVGGNQLKGTDQHTPGHQHRETHTLAALSHKDHKDNNGFWPPSLQVCGFPGMVLKFWQPDRLTIQ